MSDIATQVKLHLSVGCKTGKFDLGYLTPANITMVLYACTCEKCLECITHRTVGGIGGVGGQYVRQWAELLLLYGAVRTLEGLSRISPLPSIAV